MQRVFLFYYSPFQSINSSYRKRQKEKGGYNMNTFANCLEDFLIEGSNKTDLLRNLKEFSDHSEILLITPEDLIIKSIESINSKGLNVLTIKPEFCSARDLFPIKREQTVYNSGRNYHLITNEQMAKMGLNKETIDDLKEIGYYFEYNGRFIIPDSKFFPALCRQIGVSKLPNEADPMRELFVAYLLGCADNFKIMMRKEGRISKCLTAFSAKHHSHSQLEIAERLLENIEKKFPSAVVTYYCITQNSTTIRISIKEMALIENVNSKRKRIEPSLILSFSDVGEVALSISGYISINGRGFYIGESIGNPTWNKISDLDTLTSKVCKKIIPEMKATLKKISMVSTEECVFNIEMKKVFDSINLESDIGIGLYDMICKNASYKKCTKKDLLFEILDTAGLINKLSLLSKNKEVPLYAVKNCEKKIGTIFKSSKCKGVFGW